MWDKTTNINKRIFILTAYARAFSHGQLISSFTFNRCSVKIALCHSHIPLHHGDSAGVVNIFILKFLQKSVNFLETNPPFPLSLNIFLGLSKMLIQFFAKSF